MACVALRSLHQSSIKALDAIELADDSWLIASGGDDNALGLTVLEMDDETSEYANSALIMPNAHAAAVNAIAIIKNPRRESRQATRVVRVMTAGNDQVVKVWEIIVDSRKPGVNGVNVKQRGKHASAVADIAAIAVLNDGKRHQRPRQLKLIVSGVGTEVWRFAAEDPIAQVE